MKHSTIMVMDTCTSGLDMKEHVITRTTSTRLPFGSWRCAHVPRSFHARSTLVPRCSARVLRAFHDRAVCMFCVCDPSFSTRQLSPPIIRRSSEATVVVPHSPAPPWILLVRSAPQPVRPPPPLTAWRHPSSVILRLCGHSASVIFPSMPSSASALTPSAGCFSFWWAGPLHGLVLWCV